MISVKDRLKEANKRLTREEEYESDIIELLNSGLAKREIDIHALAINMQIKYADNEDLCKEIRRVLDRYTTVPPV